MNDESNAFMTTLSDRLIEYAGICGCAYGAGLMRQAAAQIGERDAARNMYSEICTLRTRISTLRKRLEIDRMTVYDIKGGEVVGQREVECEDNDFDTDGIACRDATIAMLEETRDTLGSQIESLTRDVEKYQKRAFVTTGIIDTLRAELDAAKVDAERLDWFEQQADEGCCPALLNDDNGHWAVSFDGFQNVPMQDEPEDIQTSFLVEAKDWHATAREAIDTARSRATSGVDAAKLIGETGEKIG